jgi:hypothetical protein
MEENKEKRRRIIRVPIRWLIWAVVLTMPILGRLYYLGQHESAVKSSIKPYIYDKAEVVGVIDDEPV